jgi:hypothetical protein
MLIIHSNHGRVTVHGVHWTAGAENGRLVSLFTSRAVDGILKKTTEEENGTGN